jgi:hypothetical protein
MFKMHEEEGLLSQDGLEDTLKHDVPPQFTLARHQNLLIKTSNITLVLNMFIFVAGIVVWAYVLQLLSNFKYIPILTGDDFEPDCKFTLQYT